MHLLDASRNLQKLSDKIMAHGINVNIILIIKEISLKLYGEDIEVKKKSGFFITKFEHFQSIEIKKLRQ